MGLITRYTFYLLCVSLLLLLTSARDAIPPHSNICACIGGTLYFAAHPADTLLYHNPDLFHDLYVYKCVTTVVFTSGDRGAGNNHSRALEHGVEAAYAWMSVLAEHNQTWSMNSVRVGDADIRVSSHPYADNVRLVYLRLPDGGPAGVGYAANNGESLRKLYTGEIESITTTDGNVTYTLDSLKDVLSAILWETGATEVRMLDHKTSVPDEHDERDDHADHAVSARLVVDVFKQSDIKAKLQGYAAGFSRRFDANLNETSIDFKRKITAFLEYAEYDQHMCQTYDECLDELEDRAKDGLFQDHDVLFAAEALMREYYVS